jgi:hypothetical protein
VGYVWYPGPDGALRKLASVWRPDGQVALLPGEGESEARAINLAGTIAGNTGQSIVRWFPGAPKETLGRPGETRGIDDAHRVWSAVSSLISIWDTNGGVGGVAAVLRRVNGSAAVGFYDAQRPRPALRISMSGERTALPVLDGIASPQWCAAEAINRQFVAVGMCDQRATLWPNTSSVIDLSAVTGVNLEIALGISDDGHIVGMTGGQGWLLTPIAEPARVALIGNSGTPFRIGETWRVSVEHSGGPADLHVAILLPDGVTTLFFTRLDTLSYIVSTIARGPYPITAGRSLSHTWHGLNEPGVYHIVAALSKPGSLADGRIDAGDLLALDWQAIHFSPGELIAGR